MNWTSSRNNILIVIFAGLLVLLSVRVYIITVAEHDTWVAEADTSSIKTVRTAAPRGEIYDRNGVLIAGNHSSYAVDFTRNTMSSKDTSMSAKALIDILNKHEEKMIDAFPIKKSKSGEFSYTFDQEIKKWLAENDMPENATAEEAFAELRKKNNIDAALTNEDAQQKLLERGISAPISIKKLKFTQEIAKENFLAPYKIESEADAKSAYDRIIKFYDIDKDFPGLSEKETRQMVVVRGALTSQGYLKWMPSKIASDLNVETVIELEEKKHDIPGVEVVTESVRYYPEGGSASHVVGYLGHISQDNLAAYEEKGYYSSDLIGLSGIESAEESILRGTDGIKRLQVNAVGAAIADLGEERSVKRGNDIALTIDMRLQKIAEDALAKSMPGIRAGGLFTSEFGNYTFKERSPNAEVGAAVVIDVKTGEPLAIANSQNFDPNLFSEGISTEDWEKLQGDNPRDPLSARPLYNVAALTAVQPGSTFKPLTGIVSQSMGLDAYRELYDGHEIKIGDTKYTCMGHHDYVNLFGALEKSCNYYFYDAATGKDWANNGNSLGYANKISVDTISDYAKKFGLGVKTGIEIGETVKPAPTADSKLAGTKAMLRQYLLGKAETLFGADLAKDYDKLSQAVDTITSWTDENPNVKELIRRFTELGVKESEAASLADTCKFTYFNYAEWTTGDQFNIAIGQGENAFTPVQMARYMATLGNGGSLESMSLIKAVEGKGEVERPAAEKTGVKKEYIKNVIEGMKRVASGGTLKGTMDGIGVSVAGKTGTAERAGYINPPDEVEYVKKHLNGINSNLAWKDVNKEMKRLMTEYPRLYSDKNVAVRKAVMNLSGKGFSEKSIDAFKETYADFSWVMAMAPAENPEIAVVCLIVQGGPSNNAAPVVRELIGQYFKLKKEDAANNVKIDFGTFFTEDKTERLVSGPAVKFASAGTEESDG